MGVRKHPFETEDLKAFEKGREIGSAAAAEKAARNAEPIWPAIDRAVSLARDLEPAIDPGSYFLWQQLMIELDAIAAKKPGKPKP